MDLIRFKKTVAGVSIAAMTLVQTGTVFAAYNDVSSGVWYEGAVNAFLNAGWLDSSKTSFNGEQNANRAEFVKLLVEVLGGIVGTSPATPTFDDVAPGAWFYDYFEDAAADGLVRGDGNCVGSSPCYARPGANINRAEASALIVRGFALPATGDAPGFTDNPAGQWYTDVIQTAADNCVLQGDDTTGRVRPGDFMNRAEMVVMLDRADQNLAYGVDCGDTIAPLVPMIESATASSETTVEVEFNVVMDQSIGASSFAVANGTVVSVSSLDWINSRTAELTLGTNLNSGDSYTVTATDVQSADGETFTDSASFSGYNPVPIGDGELEVSLSSSSPVGDTVPGGAVGVVLLTIDLSASCTDDVILEEITLVHEGLGSESELNGVYLLVDSTRVTRKRSIDSDDQTVNLRFSSPLVIPRCDTVPVKVAADWERIGAGATAYAEHNMVLQLPSDVFSNAQSVDGNFPIRGDTFRTAAINGGKVEVSYRSVSPDEIEVGDTKVVIGKFEVQASSEEDQTIYSAIFENTGSASDGDYINIGVQRTDGTVVAPAVASSFGDYTTVVFNPPLNVPEGDQFVLEVFADIIDGSNDTIILGLEEASDLFAVGSLYGFGVNGQLYGSTVEITGTADTVTIKAGEFTIEIDGPPSQNFTNDEDQAVLANVEFKSGGEAVDIQDLYFLIEVILGSNTGTAIASKKLTNVIEDVEFRNAASGRTASATPVSGSSNDFDASPATGDAADQVYRLDDVIIRGASEMWTARVDFINDLIPADATVQLHLCANDTACATIGANAVAIPGIDAEGQSTGDAITDIRPGTNVSSQVHDIVNPTLTIGVRNITGSTDFAVKQANDVPLLRFEATAGQAEAIQITQLIFTAASGSLIDFSDYTLWVDSNDDSKVDMILEAGQSSNGSAITFDDILDGGYVVGETETVFFEVHADAASTFNNGKFQLQFKNDTGTSPTGTIASPTTAIQAEEDVDDNNLSDSDIIVITRPSKLYTLIDHGTLYITKQDTPRSHQLLRGVTSVSPITILKLDAEYEDVAVELLTLPLEGASTQVNSLDLYRQGETSKIASATPNRCPANVRAAFTGGVIPFCADMQDRQLVVNKTKNSIIEVRPTLYDDSFGGFASQAFRLRLRAQSGAVALISAEGADSSGPLTINNGSAPDTGELFVGVTSPASANTVLTFNRNDTVGNKIISIVNGLSSPSQTPSVPSGPSEIGGFTFIVPDNGANSDNDVILDKLIFNVTATDVEFVTGSFVLYEEDKSSDEAPCTATGTGGAFLVTCTGLLADDDLDTTLENNGEYTFILEGNILDPNTGSNQSTLQVSLQSFNDRSKTTFGPAASHIEWLDSDTSGTSTFNWIEHTSNTVKSTVFRG